MPCTVSALRPSCQPVRDRRPSTLISVVLLLLRPPRIVLPRAVVIGTLAAMWVFELFRFSIL